jgi:hypothetical protein
MELNLIPAIQEQFEQQILAKTSYGQKELPELLKSAIITVLTKEIEHLRKTNHAKEKTTSLEYRKGKV